MSEKENRGQKKILRKLLVFVCVFLEKNVRLTIVNDKIILHF